MAAEDDAADLPPHLDLAQPAAPTVEPEKTAKSATTDGFKPPARRWIAAQTLRDEGVSFYFTEFPPDWMEEGMRKAFAELGEISSISTPKKLDKLGKRFGFVGFKSIVNSIGKTLSKLNSMKVGEFVLRANVVRFPKNSAKEYRKKPNRTTAVEVVEKKKETVSVVANPTEEETSWLKWCLVGNLQGVSRDQIVREIRLNQEFSGVHVSLLPGSQVLVQTNSENELEVFLSGKEKWKTLGLLGLRRWSPEAAEHPNDRWISLSGVPVQCWNHRIFNELAEPIGKLIQTEERRTKFQDYDSIRLLVRKKNVLQAVPNLSLVTTIGTYPIQVREEVRTWKRALDNLRNPVGHHESLLDDGAWPMLTQKDAKLNGKELAQDPRMEPAQQSEEQDGQNVDNNLKSPEAPDGLSMGLQNSVKLMDIRKEGLSIEKTRQPSLERQAPALDTIPQGEISVNDSASGKRRMPDPTVVVEEGGPSEVQIPNPEELSDEGAGINQIPSDSSDHTLETPPRNTGNRLDPPLRTYIKRTKKTSAQQEARIRWVLKQLQIAVPDLQDEQSSLAADEEESEKR